jgi:predicted MFS family arabinose efflux permease
MSDPAHERKILVLLAAVTFVNILDFVMVIPLGPQFAQGLGMATSRLGLLGTSYTGAAAVAGLVGTLFLDRFDRRSALAVTMLGLMSATAAGGLARSYNMLLGARVLAGAFGGPASSIGLAILTDVIAPERRGKALGQVMGAFSVASVVGVPVGVMLANWAGWRAPFFVVAGMGLVLVIGAMVLMPPLRGHLDRPRLAVERRSLSAFIVDPTVLLALLGMACLHLGSFVLILNLAAWVQANLGYPQADMWKPYFVGGLISFVTMRAGGILADRRGPLPIIALGSALFAAVVAVSFLPHRSWLPVLGVFVGFMLANSFRMVAMNTLSTRVPLPTERARFMSAQSAAQHTAAAAGGAISAALLTNGPGGVLVGMDRLGMLSIALTALVPAFVWLVTERLRRREIPPKVVQARGPR